MIVTGLVLGAVLLSIVGVVASFISRQRVLALDERVIDTAAQLEAAMAIQRSIRIAELQRRMAARNYWPCALLGLAFLMQIAALSVDRLAHPSIAVISILPAFFIVSASRASQRKNAQRRLDTYLRSESSRPVA